MPHPSPYDCSGNRTCFFSESRAMRVSLWNQFHSREILQLHPHFPAVHRARSKDEVTDFGGGPPAQYRYHLQDYSDFSRLGSWRLPGSLPDRFATPPWACPRQGLDKRDGNHRRSLNIRAILQAPLQDVVRSLSMRLPPCLHSLLLRSLLLRSRLWLLRPLLLISLPLRQKLLQHLRSTRQPQPFLSAQEGLGPKSRHARTRQRKGESRSEGGDGSWVRSSRKTP